MTRRAPAKADEVDAVPAMQIDISIEDRRWQAVTNLERLVHEAASAAADASGRPGLDAAELSIVLADDTAIRRLNREYRGKDRATNVLSFPAPATVAGIRMLGDIVIAFETVAAEAADEGKGLSDHVRHLVVHGVLHLLGFDHETDADAERMEALEIGILAALGVADPYAVIATADGSGSPS
jgi:probable rRNA maturation factor